MDKVAYKKAILEAGKAEHQSVIDDYRREIKELRESDIGHDDVKSDYQEMSHQNEMNEQISQLAEQLNFAVEEMNTLNRIKVEPPLHEVITLGSVVETDKRTFFVSVSIEEFEAEGDNFFGLSQKTPLYQEMKGKKKGDTFSYADITYKIKDVY